MDGQDPRKAYDYNALSNTNQDPAYGAGPSRRPTYPNDPRNSLSQSSASSSSRPDAPSLQSYGYQNIPTSMVAPSTLNQISYQENFNAVHPSPQNTANYYGYQPTNNFNIQPPLLPPSSTYEANQSYSQQRQYASMQPISGNAFYPMNAGQAGMSDAELPPLEPEFELGRHPATLAMPPVAAALPGGIIDGRTPFEEGWDRVHRELIPIFNRIKNGDLARAGDMLRELSEWFLPQVEQMQLTVDIPANVEMGYQLWHNFNCAWLALFQRQSTLILNDGALDRGVHTMPFESMLRLMDRLIELNKANVEDRGLLDYQWGVWEKDILAAANTCLELSRPAQQGGH